jgi:SAM-dependent methyltransferase
MPALSDDVLEIHLPPAPSAGGLDQDEEWCELETADGRRRRIRFHDYAEIFNVPGLYEALFAKRLDCDSPAVVTGLLRDELAQNDIEPEGLSVLDFGAGNGMVGEELAASGIGTIVGVDLLDEARRAAERDRPGVYDDYVAADITALEPAVAERLRRHDFDCLTCVAALGFGDVPPEAFLNAFDLVRNTGLIAFNLRERFLDEQEGFGGLIAEMFDRGLLEERKRVRYRHRLSITGEPLHYLAFVAAKREDSTTLRG